MKQWLCFCLIMAILVACCACAPQESATTATAGATTTAVGTTTTTDTTATAMDVTTTAVNTTATTAGTTATATAVTTTAITAVTTTVTQATTAAHAHQYTAAVTLPKGTQKGYAVYTCACGDSYREQKLPRNAYDGKIIACIGDSITVGVGTTEGVRDYVTVLSNRLGMDYIRLGENGTVLCEGGRRKCNIDKLTVENLLGADVVTILMGINDFCMGDFPLGDANADGTTIYSSLKIWCERVRELKQTPELKDTQFYFMTPVITSWNNSVTEERDWDQSKKNAQGYTLRELCETIIAVCWMYDLPVIDLNRSSGMYYNSPDDNSLSKFGGDGIHPDDRGHNMMSKAIQNALLQTEG